MTFAELRPQLLPGFKTFTKRDFVSYCQAVDQRSRVGGPRGKGRITAKRALLLLGARQERNF
jgi:hypothetical protein